MGRIGCVRRENPDVTYWQELSHQLHQFTLFCIEFHVVTKRAQMHPNTMQRTKTGVQGPMGWIGCVRREKSQCDFVARAFALTALVHPVLHRVSCGFEFHVVTKRSQMHPNTMQRPTNEFRLQWSGQCALVAKKSLRDFVARTFALIAPVHTVLHRVSCNYETIPNAPKHYATHQNMSLGSNVVDCSLRKIRTWICGTNFCINCTSSHRFAPTFMQLRNNNR